MLWGLFDIESYMPVFDQSDLQIFASLQSVTVSWRDPENIVRRGTADLSALGDGEWEVNRVLVQGPGSPRGRGVGSRLLRTALAEVSKMGGRRVLVAPGGYGSDPIQQRRFYEKNGFVADSSQEGLLVWVKPKDAD